MNSPCLLMLAFVCQQLFLVIGSRAPWAVWGVGYSMSYLGFRLIADGVLCVFPAQLSVCLLFIFVK